MSNNQMVSVPLELAEGIVRMLQGSGGWKTADQLSALLAQPADQHQGKPINLTAVATLVDDGDGGLEASWLLEGGTAELFAGMTLLVAERSGPVCRRRQRAGLQPRRPCRG